MYIHVHILLLFFKGAPERILSRCKTYLLNGEVSCGEAIDVHHVRYCIIGATH